MAADTPWKTRQMSALRSRVEISNDRRPHFMVLLALPEAKVTQASSLTRSGHAKVPRRIGAIVFAACHHRNRCASFCNSNRWWRCMLCQAFGKQCGRGLSATTGFYSSSSNQGQGSVTKSFCLALVASHSSGVLTNSFATGFCSI